MSDLVKELMYYYYTPNTCEKEVGAFLNTKRKNFYPYYYNNLSNDLRHQYTSAVMTRDKGAGITKTLGYMNEILPSLEPNERGDSQRDLKANEIGRNFAIKNPNLSNQQMLEKLYYNYLSQHKF